MVTRILLLAIAMFLSQTPVWADLFESSVTGKLKFHGDGKNYWDPRNQLVPSGFLNREGTIVDIEEPAVEFGYQDARNLYTANFTATQLVISDNVFRTGSSTSFHMHFTSDAFTELLKILDTFPGGLHASFEDKEMSFKWDGGSVQAGSMFSAVYEIAPRGPATGEIAPIPEPTSLVLLATIAAGVCVLSAKITSP